MHNRPTPTITINVQAGSPPSVRPTTHPLITRCWKQHIRTYNNNTCCLYTHKGCPTTTTPY